MPKIIFVESTGEMGGVEFSTLYLAQKMRELDWDVSVVLPEDGRFSKMLRDARVPYDIVKLFPIFPTSIQVGYRNRRIPNPLGWIWNSFSLMLSIFRLHRYLKADIESVIVSKGLIAHFWGGLASVGKPQKVIWYLQDFISERFAGIYLHFFNFAAKYLSDVIIVDGMAIAEQLSDSLQDQVHVILNGVDMELFSPNKDGERIRNEFNISQDKIVIGHVARMTPWKGQHLLIEAFASIADQQENATLLLVGSSVFDMSSYEKNLRARVVALGIEDKVIFTGYRDDLPSVFSAIDIFAYPSIEKDTSPLVVISAMGCALPIVCFDIPGLREVLADTAIFVSNKNTVELAQALKLLCKDENLRQQMRKRVRLRAKTELGLQRYVNEFTTTISGYLN